MYYAFSRTVGHHPVAGVIYLVSWTGSATWVHVLVLPDYLDAAELTFYFNNKPIKLMSYSVGRIIAQYQKNDKWKAKQWN
ncbi:hypothetical protein [Aureliella helgolandensis]|uniref:Uncharacterized protein n=1 Tax=Aureliella helgolandensis TaxID=2527968 RepID=A0A518GEE2_9BACT|nr:hypothetical protein [Aureliella helgolandensis]QDV26971.1 hypothetical protein Q31a_53510 [Aureliella helgolandensis]